MNFGPFQQLGPGLPGGMNPAMIEQLLKRGKFQQLPGSPGGLNPEMIRKLLLKQRQHGRLPVQAIRDAMQNRTRNPRQVNPVARRFFAGGKSGLGVQGGSNVGSWNAPGSQMPDDPSWIPGAPDGGDGVGGDEYQNLPGLTDTPNSGMPISLNRMTSSGPQDQAQMVGAGRHFDSVGDTGMDMGNIGAIAAGSPMVNPAATPDNRQDQYRQLAQMLLMRKLGQNF